VENATSKSDHILSKYSNNELIFYLGDNNNNRIEDEHPDSLLKDNEYHKQATDNAREVSLTKTMLAPINTH